MPSRKMASCVVLTIIGLEGEAVPVPSRMMVCWPIVLAGVTYMRRLYTGLVSTSTPGLLTYIGDGSMTDGTILYSGWEKGFYVGGRRRVIDVIIYNMVMINV
jgi:hypothetical protein